MRLTDLPASFPEQYHLQAMELLCKFVQLSTSDVSSDQSTPTHNEERKRRPDCAQTFRRL